MSAFAIPPQGASRANRARPATPRALPKWGWIEWFIVSQTVLPALLFLPGITPVRVLIRVSAFASALVAWGMVVKNGKGLPGADTFTANIWIKLVIGWLALMILHPEGNSFIAAIGEATLYLAIICPAFWAPSVLITPRQVGRMMMILFACNALSAAVGIGQVFRPGIFNPPVIAALQRYEEGFVDGALVYQDDFGNKITRPCGLTDQIGNAANAGATAALIGLCVVLRPGGLFRRGLILLFSFAGVAVIYYSQVRMSLVTLVLCLGAMSVIFMLQRNFGYAVKLGIGSAALISGAFSWVVFTSGTSVIKRFLTLTEGDVATSIMNSRGMYVQNALTELIWEYPVGRGMGWFGQIYDYFGTKVANNTVWSEVMISAWIFDGGIPLLLFYSLAIVAALWSSLRIALRTPDRELAFWATVILASNLAIVASCFSFMTFIAPLGIQFWLTSSALHAADMRVRSESPAARPRTFRGRRPAAPPPRMA